MWRNLTAALLFVCATSAVAEVRPEGSSPCEDLVKECFAYSDTHLANCFFTAGRHPFCEGTLLGKLAARRAAMSPVLGLRDTAPALTGPQLIDTECIANFDSQLSARLIEGDGSAETLRHLEATLESCVRAPANELLRP